MAKGEEPGLGDQNKEEQVSKEGRFLLGSATFEDIGNGRFKCLQTGHEMPAKDVESYGHSKRCRLALIDLALAQKKAPLNLFKQDPLSRSRLICKLTGDIINKSEEHIWKHINGKRFLNKLEQKEAEKLQPVGKAEKDDGPSRPKVKSVKKDKKNEARGDYSQATDPADRSHNSEEPDFWVPPIGSRWDFDDGNDRWGSCPNSGDETDDGIGTEADEQIGIDSGELSTRTKRMSIEVGPSSFASRKKKSKGDHGTTPSGK